MTPHVPLSPALKLPPEFQHVTGFLARFDADLRVRRSAERRELYVIERRCRRRPAVNTGMRDRSDMHVQARDGYIHLSTVHPSWLNAPWKIVRELVETGVDLWNRGAIAVDNELLYEENWAKETRRRRRRQTFRDIGREAYVMATRRGNKDGTERSRLSVPSNYVN